MMAMRSAAFSTIERKSSSPRRLPLIGPSRSITPAEEIGPLLRSGHSGNSIFCIRRDEDRACGPLRRHVGGQGKTKLVDQNRQVANVERRSIGVRARFLTVERRGCNCSQIVRAGGACKRVKLGFQVIHRLASTIDTGCQGRCDRFNAIRHLPDEAILELDELSLEYSSWIHGGIF